MVLDSQSLIQACEVSLNCVFILTSSHAQFVSLHGAFRNHPPPQVRTDFYIGNELNRQLWGESGLLAGVNIKLQLAINIRDLSR